MHAAAIRSVDESEGAPRAAVVTGPNRLELEPLLPRKLGDNEVRVRLAGCGVCASNLVPWSGPEWMQFPTEPGGLGHEAWGVVEAVGDAVASVRPGDHVTTLFQNGYAEIDQGHESLVAKLPDHLSKAPFPGEPLGCAMNIFRRSNIQRGQTLAIVGFGFLGALLCQLAKQVGAKVIAVSRRDFSLRVAGENGADYAFNSADPWEVVRRVQELTGGRMCERVIEAAGKQEALDLASELVAERGQLIIAGYHQDGPRRVNMQQWNWRGIDVINAHERDPAVYMSGIRAAIDAVESGMLRPAPLYTHRFPLERLDEALNMTRDRPDGFVKALVMMQ